MQPNLIISFKTYSEGVNQHIHDFHQLVVPIVGTMEVEIDGAGGYLTNSRGVIIPAASRHEFNAYSGSSYIVADIPVDFIHESGAGVSMLRALGEQFFTVPLSFKHLINFLKESSNEHISFCADAWLKLALSIIDPSHTAPLESKNTPLTKAIAFMEVNLDKAITCKHISLAAGVSERKLNYLFNQLMQITPHAYLLELRIERAIGMLSSSNLPISEVAFTSGFSDQSALTHAMKRIRGITPAKLRRDRA